MHKLIEVLVHFGELLKLQLRETAILQSRLSERSDKLKELKDLNGGLLWCLFELRLKMMLHYSPFLLLLVLRLKGQGGIWRLALVELIFF